MEEARQRFWKVRSVPICGARLYEGGEAKEKLRVLPPSAEALQALQQTAA
jgi:hypothetical protein